MSPVVYLPRRLEPEFEDPLRAALDPSIELLSGALERRDYEVLVAGVPTPEELDASPHLRVLVIPWAGLPARTRELLLERPRIDVHNLHHNAAPVAETALGLLLAAAKLLVPMDRRLRAFDWTPRYESRAGSLLAGRRALVLGYGHVGRRLGAACAALGMRVTGIRRRPDPGAEDEASPGRLHELLPDCHALLSCLPVTEATRGWIGEAELALLPRGALVVNVGRAEVFDEDALYGALAGGHLGGAGLDVWYRYPEDEAARRSTAPSARPFHELENVVLSPHRAGHCDGTARLRAEHLARLLNAAARGEPLPDRVDLERGY